MKSLNYICIYTVYESLSKKRREGYPFLKHQPEFFLWWIREDPGGDIPATLWVPPGKVGMNLLLPFYTFAFANFWDKLERYLHNQTSIKGQCTRIYIAYKYILWHIHHSSTLAITKHVYSKLHIYIYIVITRLV